jgi:integrase
VVLSRIFGKPLFPINKVRHKFEPALKRAGLEKIRFHDLRHTYAAIRIDLGENAKYMQTQMGHSSIKVSLMRPNYEVTPYAGAWVATSRLGG